VLLILSDGCIMDMQPTLTALVNASGLPLSLLIVGVGQADFAAMEALDGDKLRIRAPDGRSAVRDTVQFCELRPKQASVTLFLSVRPVLPACQGCTAKAPRHGCPVHSHCVACATTPLQRDTVEGLATKLLAELPGQVVEYLNDIRRIPPPAKTQAPPPPAYGVAPHLPPAVGMAPPPPPPPPPAVAAGPPHAAPSAQPQSFYPPF
jgi:hypothetical protein